MKIDNKDLVVRMGFFAGTDMTKWWLELSANRKFPSSTATDKVLEEFLITE